MEAQQTPIDLGFHPHRYQRELIRSLASHRFGIAVTHRRWGKTRLAVQLLVHCVLTCKHPRPRAAYIAPRLKQAKQSAWLYLTDVATRIPGHRILESELAVELPGDRRITLYGGSDGNEEGMRGIYLDGAVIDEYADVAPHALDQIILPTLADRHGWLLVIGTPKGMDAFYQLFHQDAPKRGWFRAIYRVDETRGEIPALPPDEIDALQMQMSPLAWRQEMLCDFAAARDDAFISMDLISESAGKKYEPKDILYAPVVLGVDVARYGSDRSVIQRRQGLVAMDPVVLSGVNNMHLAGLVADQIGKYKVDATFIDAGRGEGVIDRLRQLGFRAVHEINFGSRKVMDEHWHDKRTEMWALLRKWMEEGGSIPNHADLKTDLAGPRYEFTAAGQVKLESKDKMKERGLPSTDLADALALTFALPVASPVLHQQMKGRWWQRQKVATM